MLAGQNLPDAIIGWASRNNENDGRSFSLPHGDAIREIDFGGVRASTSAVELRTHRELGSLDGATLIRILKERAAINDHIRMRTHGVPHLSRRVDIAIRCIRAVGS